MEDRRKFWDIYKPPVLEIPPGVKTFELNDYELEEEFLGSAGTGQVTKAKNISTGDDYAIKRIAILQLEEGDERHIRQILHDMALATSVDHPNVMQCQGVCSDESGIYFLYHLMPTNLGARRSKTESTLAYIAFSVLKGLRYLRKEKNFYFKHLTPNNILFDPVSRSVKITDVGIMKDKFITLHCVTFKMPFIKFIAPENFHPGNLEADLQSKRYQKSDSWSLGLCLLQLYNQGKYPLDYKYYEDKPRRYLFSLSPPDEYWPPKPPSHASPLFRDFISLCLELDVPKRASVDQLLAHQFLLSHGYGFDPVKDDHPHLPLTYEDDGSKIQLQKIKPTFSNETIVGIAMEIARTSHRV